MNNLQQYRKQGKKMNNSVLWSNSNTKQILTEYAEGLACNNFDRRLLYHVRQISQHQWMVIYKESILSKSGKISSGVSFQRVRKVTIDRDGYMTCTCGYVQRMLMPCTHVCAVIGNMEYYEPSMFHIRWYKMFNYYYRDVEKNEFCLKTNGAVENLLLVTRENGYHADGKYKGIYAKGTKFYEKCENYVPSTDPITKLMQYIDKRICDKGPIIMDNPISIELFEERAAGNKEVVVSDLIDDITDNDMSMGFGGSSQVEGNLSQNALLYQEDDYNTSGNDESYYSTALPLFRDMINTCHNKKVFEECMMLMRNQIAKNLSSKSRNQEELSTESVHLYGENKTSKKSVKRHKTIGEKICN